ncbi:hypothetical protein [Saccharothrix sp. NRRL B-16314]|uniref:hypothetical protein n=1 Tax=Saccharothrix sp. NRRL B-16314 TaxID=1463825 RepID=UPI00052656A0|nr:hypothetical protein [Saccharothrix sp. NRRL B-16314]
MWDLTTGEEVGRPETRFATMAFSLATVTIDGRPLVVTGGGDYGTSGRVRLWDVATGRVVGRELRFPAPVNSVAVAPGDASSSPSVTRSPP